MVSGGRVGDVGETYLERSGAAYQLDERRAVVCCDLANIEVMVGGRRRCPSARGKSAIWASVFPLCLGIRREDQKKHTGKGEQQRSRENRDGRRRDLEF